MSAVRAKTLIAAIAVAGVTLAASAFPGATTAATATQTFAPTADAYVNTTDTTNTGTSTNLYTDGSPVVYSYIRFNPSGLTGSTVTKATLRVFANTAGSSTQTYDVHTTTSSTWGESTITSANAPTFGLTIGSYGPIASGTWTSVDVTSAVQADSPVTFVLSTSGSTNIRYSSRESATPPELVVETQSQATATPPANTAAPTISGTAQQGQTLTATQRQLERHHADQLQLPVAALRHGRRQLQQHQRRDRPDLPARQRRRRHHHPSRRHRQQQRRQQQRNLRPDRNRAGGNADDGTGEHGGADDQRHGRSRGRR